MLPILKILQCQHLARNIFRYQHATSTRTQQPASILRRALLYVPGDDQRKIAKSQKLKVDAVILDCEDGVALNRKQAARETIAQQLQNLDPAHTNWGARVNGVETGLVADDLKVLFSGPVRPATVYLPKVETAEHLDAFDTALSEIAARGSGSRPIDLFFYAESCRSIMDLPALCRHAIRLADRQSAPRFRLAGMVLGSDDLLADLGAVRTESSVEILYARQRFVLVARAFRLQAIDMVDINLKNMEGLRVGCEEGARMGFTGKQVIHPAQVDIVQAAFRPSDMMIEWARELLEAFATHQKSGKGAFVFRNQMIDAPTMKQAQNIVAMDRVD